MLALPNLEVAFMMKGLDHWQMCACDSPSVLPWTVSFEARMAVATFMKKTGNEQANVLC